MARFYPDSWHNGQAIGYGASIARLPASGSHVAYMESCLNLPAGLSDDEMESRLESIIKHRRSRRMHFSDDLFADPAWDILLELALAECQQRRVSISRLCIGSQVPATTALRWIKHMTDNGWLVRRDDPLDGRRKFAELSENASRQMRAFLASVDQKAAV